jgi:hypothetical protein
MNVFDESLSEEQYRFAQNALRKVEGDGYKRLLAMFHNYETKLFVQKIAVIIARFIFFQLTHIII